jgi:transcriptional regulator with XRE-family HTH domain
MRNIADTQEETLMTKEELRFIRISRGLSVRDFAKRINVSYSLISRIEGGERRLTDSVKNKIAGAFGLTDEKLLAIKLLIKEVKN